MPESSSNTTRALKSLNVLPSSSKLDQWRQESGPSAASSPEFALVSHVNRAESAGLDLLSRHPLEEAVVQALRGVFDPELPVNIYDLGLVYEIVVSPESEVAVKMTLTAPGCPVAGTLPPEIQRRIESVPGVRKAAVELVWQPPWGREMMSELARLELGL
jgi:FeS assembly SUF system protein